MPHIHTDRHTDRETTFALHRLLSEPKRLRCLCLTITSQSINHPQDTQLTIYFWQARKHQMHLFLPFQEFFQSVFLLTVDYLILVWILGNWIKTLGNVIIKNVIGEAFKQKFTCCYLKRPKITKQELKALLDPKFSIFTTFVDWTNWMIKSLKIVTYVLWLLTCCYMSWYCTMLRNFGTSIWYSWLFHNVRVLHHVMHLLNW